MTAQLLNSELSTLIQDSKRKNQELKNAAEKSLAELKALPQTSEAQLSADLKNRPTFVRPFLLACGTRNTKFAGSAVICLQRLVVSKALARESLKGVLEAFRECATLALDIQLKVLQALPSLLQNYSGALSDRLLAAAFEVCFSLYSSKTAVVSNTAAAALQQLLASTFEKVTPEDDSSDAEGSTIDVPTADGVIRVRGAASDAFRLLNDICLMTEGQRPTFLAAGALSQNFGFELIESALTNYADTIMDHPEQLHVLRLQLMPLILKILSDKVSFSTTVRVMRLLQLIISRLLFALAPECETALNMLNRIVEADTPMHWKRALALEVFRDFQADSTLMRSMYAHFDEDGQRKDIIRDHLAGLVRLASEKPNIIGFGPQSSMSAKPKDDWADQVALQTGGIVGSIGSAMNASESDGFGISTRWSIPRTPCLELLDKAEPPILPPTYLYSLAVTCISNFSDGLGKFLLPFTSPKENKPKKKDRVPMGNGNNDVQPAEAPTTASRRRSLRGKKVPVNPLSLEHHVLYRQIQTSAHMVDNCWPALLAVSSTFLNATLDSDFYHALIRSFQKFTQVAGLLGLATPRDAFLTTLAKHSVPIRRNVTLMMRTSLDLNSQPESTENSDIESSPTPSKRSSIDQGSVAMTARNLLCLRALLNLGIALGPLLQSSWSIILETLQQADFMLPRSSKGRTRVTNQSSQASASQIVSEESKNGEDFGLEILAAETAAARMIESSSDLPDDAFLDLVKCLGALLRSVRSEAEPIEEARDGLLSPQTPIRKHQRLPSLSVGTSEGAELQGDMFVLDKLESLIKCNTTRLTSTNSSNCLDSFIQQLGAALCSRISNKTVRIKSAEILGDLAVSIATSAEVPAEDQDILRQRAFFAISRSISSLDGSVRLRSKDSQNCDIEIHRIILEALRSILEQRGDSIQSGWDTIFAIITSTFERATTSKEDQSLSEFRTRSPKLVRSSYGSLQLVCSDYLNNVPLACLPTLLDTLFLFCSQSQDLNISLTTTTFFANVSGFLQSQSGRLEFDQALYSCSSDADVESNIKDRSSKFPLSALWLLLLLRLRDITVDQRLEVRHSALHTLFRSFSDCGDDLSASAWRACFLTVIRPLLRANEQKHGQSSSSSEVESKVDVAGVGWNSTAVVIVDGIAGLISSNLNTMKSDKNFDEMWQELLECFKLLLDRQVLELSKSVFAALVSILEEIEDGRNVSAPAIDEAWTLWKQSNPAFHSSHLANKSDNQDAMLSYLRCLSQILRLRDSESRINIAEAVMVELRSSVINANVGAYSTDVDRVTPVQQGVVENLKMIPATSPAVLSHIVAFLTFLVRLPYDKEKPKRQGQTHLAISKTAIGMLQKLVISHFGKTSSPYELVAQALGALAEPIFLKYKWYFDGKASSAWRPATTGVLEILENCMPKLMETQSSDDNVVELWKQVVYIINGVGAADYESCIDTTNIAEDQDFDIDAFHRLQKISIPALGSECVPDSIRKDYATTMFENSYIFEPHPDDFARPGEELLDGLKRNHIGRTYNVPSTPRSRMSYVLLDELFSLVAVHDGTPERVRLSQAAAPYLLLRVGLVLKAYILDHPLRGRAPQPTSQKNEMLYVLKKLVDLDCEPHALPVCHGVQSQHKKHLYRLYPLITKALKVSFRDEELKAALGEVLDAVGLDFGV